MATFLQSSNAGYATMVSSAAQGAFTWFFAGRVGLCLAERYQVTVLDPILGP